MLFSVHLNSIDKTPPHYFTKGGHLSNSSLLLYVLMRCFFQFLEVVRRVHSINSNTNTTHYYKLTIVLLFQP